MTYGIRSFCLVVQIIFQMLFLGVISSSAETIAYYRFENGIPGSPASGVGTILDSSGHGLNGTAINGPTYSSDVPTHIIPQTGALNNLSLSFNGSDQRVYIPDNSLFKLTHSLTLEAYIKPFSDPTSKEQIVFRGDDRIGLDPYYLSLEPGGKAEFFIQNAKNQAAFITAALPAIDQWSYIAGTLNGKTGVMDLYINGILSASTTTNIRPLGELDKKYTPGIGIGNVQSGNYNEYFNGLIDEVRISNEALNPSQFLDAKPVPEPRAMILEISGFAIFFIIYRLSRNRRSAIVSIT